MSGKATRDDDMPGADGSDVERQALEEKHAKRIYTAFQAVLLKIAPENTTTNNVTVDKAIERWRDNRNIVRDALVDMLTDGVLLGADVGRQQVEYLLGVAKAVSVTGVDWDMINVNALQWVTGGGQFGVGLGDGYANALLDTMTQTTENGLRTIFGEWIRNNLSYGQLVQQLDRTVFGRRRAEMVATTEITRAYAEGNRAAWRNSRIIKKMRWQAVGDERTCAICGPLNQTTAELDRDFGSYFPPAHPRCRCWVTPVPVVEGFDQSQFEPTVEQRQERVRQQLEQSSAGKNINPVAGLKQRYLHGTNHSCSFGGANGTDERQAFSHFCAFHHADGQRLLQANLEGCQ